MKIKTAARPDARHDTYHDSRDRALVRVVSQDIKSQIMDIADGEVADANTFDAHDDASWLAYGQDEWQNWWNYQDRK